MAWNWDGTAAAGCSLVYGGRLFVFGARSSEQTARVPYVGGGLEDVFEGGFEEKVSTARAILKRADEQEDDVAFVLVEQALPLLEEVERELRAAFASRSVESFCAFVNRYCVRPATLSGSG